MLYPLGLLVASILEALVHWGVSPYSFGRPLLLAVGVGLLLPWLFGLLTGDRDRAGILAATVVAFLVVGTTAVQVVALLAIFVAVLAAGLTAGSARLPWPLVTRAMTVVTAIAFVAIGIAAAQDGTVLRVARDVVSESPLGRLGQGVRAASAAPESVYLVLLDSYPRADKLASEFGINGESFLRALEERRFDVAELSRSNHLSTDRTLASMLGGWTPGRDRADAATLRAFINEGSMLRAFRDLGYEIVATSSSVESVAVRQADRFIDTGQINEAEWHLVRRGGLVLIPLIIGPTLFADQQRDRLVATLGEAYAVARDTSERPRFALFHLLSPHAPLVVDASGAPIATDGWVDFYDLLEYENLGHEEYARRLGGQIAYLNERTLGLVDTIIAADPEATVVVFSDHGSGIRETAEGFDADLRTANLLAVRNPGRADIVDDRSTLVNVLPRILRSITGDGPADVPEMIWLRPTGAEWLLYDRPD